MLNVLPVQLISFGIASCALTERTTSLPTSQTIASGMRRSFSSPRVFRSGSFDCNFGTFLVTKLSVQRNNENVQIEVTEYIEIKFHEPLRRPPRGHDLLLLHVIQATCAKSLDGGLETKPLGPNEDQKGDIMFQSFHNVDIGFQRNY